MNIHVAGGGGGAEEELVKGIKDLRVQERECWSVLSVAWTDWEGGPGPSSHPSLSHQPFPALAAQPRFMGKSCCKASSILLLPSVLVSGEQPVRSVKYKEYQGVAEERWAFGTHEMVSLHPQSLSIRRED